MKKELCRILVLLLLVNSCSASMIDKFRTLFNRNRSLATQTNTARVGRNAQAVPNGAQNNDLVRRLRAKAERQDSSLSAGRNAKPKAPHLRTWGHVRQQAGKAPFRNARLRRPLPRSAKHLVHRK